jgi:hypothetical protein
MANDADLLKGSSWSLAIGTATRHVGTASPDFYGLYSGDDLGSPGRGVVAAIATADGSWEAAQIAVNGFAEGYFGAGEALSPARAAARSLSSINSWLHSQSVASRTGRGLHSSFSAILFAGRRIAVLHIGDCRIYSCRHGEISPLTPDRFRSEGRRLLGSDEALQIERIETDVQEGDRFILLSAGAADCFDAAANLSVLGVAGDPKTVAQQIKAFMAEVFPNHTASVMVVDLVDLPRLAYDDVSARFADLPIRKPPQDGDLLDGFRIGRTINRGRYTLLKRARDEANSAEVVLKFPLPSMLTDQVFRAGFLREAWVGTTIRSECVARYLDIPGDRQTCLYLAMPFYKGDTLEWRLLHPPRVSLAEGCGVALKLCSAVTELAKHGVVHRDIKPENVMLLSDGNVILLDLGLAYLVGIDDPEEDRLGGTTRYMAPEVFSGTAPNARTEVFSLGVTIYRMFTRGRFPFGQGERVPLKRLRPDLPVWLGLCLKAAISTNPADRFADAASFAAALHNGLVRGDMRPGGIRLQINPLWLWQAAAVMFALSTLYLWLMR